MTSKERVLGALNRTGYDRIPIKHEGTPGINHMIMEHFGLTNMEQLLRVVGEDFRYVEPVYIGPELRTFADGHSEWWAWKDPRTIALMVKLDWGVHGDNLGIVQDGNPDLIRVQKGIWGNDLGYKY